MKNRCFLAFTIYIAVLTAFFTSKAISADITEIGPSARPISMGRAYSAVEDSVDCILFNPAGLAGIDSLRLSSMYSNLSNDFSYASFALALPVRYGTIGFAMLHEQSGVLYRTALDSDGKVVTDGSSAPFNFTSQVYVLSFAGQLDKKLSAGARLKLYEKEALVEGGHGTGTSLDIGLLYKLDPRTSLGLYHENLLSSGISWLTGTRDPLPSRIKAGIMFRAGQDLTFVLDAVISQNRPFSLKSGGEWRVHELLFLRAGLEQADIGGERYLNYSLGAGSNFKTFYINYAYTADTVLKENSSHFVSISFEIPSFYKPTAEAAPAATEEAKKQPKEKKPDIPEIKKPEPEKTEKPKPKKDLSKGILEKEEISVRNKINALDEQIRISQAKKDDEKIQALKQEKWNILMHWEELKNSTENPLGSEIRRTN